MIARLPRTLQAFLALLGPATFLAALLSLYHELSGWRLADLGRSLADTGLERLLAALALTAAGWLVITGYDVLVLREAGHPLPYARVGLASFVGLGFVNSIGHPLVTSTPIHFRLYAAEGVPVEGLTRAAAAAFAAFWLGFLALFGALFTFAAIPLSDAFGQPVAAIRALGIAAVVPLVYSLGFTIARRHPLRIAGWPLELPSLSGTAPILILSVVDWVLGGAALFVLLPGPQPGIAVVLGVFLLARLAGLLSQVPGGLGVFEAVSVALLPQYPATTVLATVLLFRFVHQALPILLATTLVAGRELVPGQAELGGARRWVARWAPSVVPHLFAVTTFVGGAMLLLSGSLPRSGARLAWISHMVPLPVLELSHFLGSIVGVGLLLLARGLQRRLDGAYFLTMVLLVAGIVVSLLRGLAWIEAASLAVMLLVLWPCRRSFYRRSSLWSEPWTAGWIAAVGLTLAAAMWLFLFSYRHIEYSQELFWQVAVQQVAPRSLRALVGASAVALGVGLARLLRTRPPEPDPPSADELALAGSIAESSPDPMAHLAQLGDKTLLIHPSRRAFLMFAVEGRSWVVLGDPIGPEDTWNELIWTFRALVERHDGWPVFYRVKDESLHHYVEIGLGFFKLGEEGRVSLAGFSLEGGSKKEFRRSQRKMDEAGCSFEILPANKVPSVLCRLREISDAWLREKGAGEKRFSLGFFDPEYLAKSSVAVVRQGGEIIAFANVLSGADRSELTVDLMRYVEAAPRGVMDYLFINLMLWGANEQYRWFGMGMAPLAGLENRMGSSLWNRLGLLIYRHGEHFYNFRGLRAYKEKFEPTWRPRYLAAPPGFALPKVLTNVTTLIAGGMGSVVRR